MIKIKPNKTYEKAQDLYIKAKDEDIPINMAVGQFHTLLLNSGDPFMRIIGTTFKNQVDVYTKDELVKSYEKDYPNAWQKEYNFERDMGIDKASARTGADSAKAYTKNMLEQARDINADWVQIKDEPNKSIDKVIPANYHCLDIVMHNLRTSLYQSCIGNRVNASIRKHADDSVGILKIKDFHEPSPKAPVIDGQIYMQFMQMASDDDDGNMVMPKCSLKLAISLFRKLIMHNKSGVTDKAFNASLHRLIKNGNLVLA